jgi:hypothetical protein
MEQYALQTPRSSPSAIWSLILLSVPLANDSFILHKENFFSDCAQALHPLY